MPEQSPPQPEIQAHSAATGVVVAPENQLESEFRGEARQHQAEGFFLFGSGKQIGIQKQEDKEAPASWNRNHTEGF